MSAFKDMVARDIATTFLNLDELGELHTVEGTEITAMLDNSALKERQSGGELSIAEASAQLYAAIIDLPERRAPGATLNIDGCEYIVAGWSEDMGLATVALTGSVGV